MNIKEFDNCKIYSVLRWKGPTEVFPKGTLVKLIVKYMNHKYDDDFAGHEYIGRVIKALSKGSKSAFPGIEFRLSDVELKPEHKHITKAQFKKCKVGDKLHWIGFPGMYDIPYGTELTIDTIYTENLKDRSTAVCVGRGRIDRHEGQKLISRFKEFKLTDVALPTKLLNEGDLKMKIPNKPAIDVERIKAKVTLAKCPCCGTSAILYISPPTVKCTNGDCGLQVTSDTYKKAAFRWNNRVHTPAPEAEPALEKGEERITINEDEFYKLGGQVDEIMPGHVITDARQVYWCHIEQKWKE